MTLKEKEGNKGESPQTPLNLRKILRLIPEGQTKEERENQRTH